MFFRKNKEQEQKKQTICHGCGAYIDEINLVRCNGNFSNWDYYYCGKCKKPYDKAYYPFPEVDLPIRYFKTSEVEVTEDGKPVKSE